MKSVLNIFLYLNIYTAFLLTVNAQQINLDINAEINITSEILSEISPLSTFNNYADLEKETNRILIAFQKKGFIDARLISIKKKSDSDSSDKKIRYEAKYFLGIQFSNITIHFDPENFSRKEMELVINKIVERQFTIPIGDIENTLSKLNSLQIENGDAFAKIYLKNFKKQNGKISAELISETTTTRKIDSIIVNGYEKFPKSYLKHSTGLKKGDVFSPSKIEKANEVIEALPFATNIKDPEVLFKNEQTTIYLYLKKQKSNNFDGIIGFNTDETTNRLVFNGYLDLQLNNNLNFGETFVLNYKSDGNNQQNFNVRTTLPYLFKSPIGINLGLTIFRQAENFATTDQIAGLQYQINPNTQITLNYTGTNSTLLSEDNNTTPGIADYKKSELAIGNLWRFYQVDNLFPIKTSLNLKLGSGTKETDLGSERQFSLTLRAFHIFKLNTENSIYVKNDTGFLNSETYLTNELYRIGGINSIRGFNENSITTNLYSLLNTEYRYRFSNLLYLHSIVDLGYLENEITNQTSSLYSFGLGAGLFTKTGLLKLSFANGRIEGQDFNFSDLKIHFSLITTF